MAIDIMKKGFNIILEKPPGKDVDEINEMITEAKKANVNVRVAFNRRYAPLLIKLKELIKESGEEITNITYQMYRHNRRESDFSTTAIHAIDAVKYIAEVDYKKVNYVILSKVRLYVNLSIPKGLITIKDIEKAILASDIGITPTNDGKAILIVFPQLTEERRKEIVKTLRKKGEDSKVAIRSIRRDAMEDAKLQKKNGEITEDDVKNVEILGYFCHNDYTGIIKYSSDESKPIFEEENGEYIIYLNNNKIKDCEDKFILKLGYWSYYIDKVVSRYKQQELDYHENALNYANKLLKENMKGNKKKPYPYTLLRGKL